MELQAEPLTMEFDSSFYRSGKLRLREQTEDKGKESTEISQLLAAQLGLGLHYPDSGCRPTPPKTALGDSE